MSELQSKDSASRPSRVHWSLSFTANLGNFESLRIEGGVETDSRPGENVVQALNRVYEVVENELMVKVRDAKEAIAAIDKEVNGDDEAEGS